MQVKDAYDLVVIGDQLSGLFLAAGAAQMGKKVLVLEESSVPTVSYEIPSGRFLGDFVTEPLIGLEEGSAVDSFLRSLGLYQNLDDLFPRHEPALQIVGKKFRLDFSYDSENLQWDIRREFGGDAEKVHRLLSGKILEKNSFGRAVAAAGLPVDYELFGWMQAAAYGPLAPSDLSYPAYKDILSLAAKGVRYPLGGRSALKERLLSRVTVFGGSIKRSTRVEEVVFERGKLAGVLLSSYEGFVRSRMVVGAMGAKTFLGLIPVSHQSSRLVEAVRKIQPRFWRLGFTLLVPESVIPEGMGSHVVLLDEEMLQFQVFPKGVYGGVPAGHRALVVRSLMPYADISLSERVVAQHLKKSLKRMGELLPFLRESPFLISPDPEKLSQDPVFQRYYRFPDLDHIPPIFLVYETALSSMDHQGEFLDWSRFGMPGLALCSRDNYSLFGSTGEIMAAMDLLALFRKRAEGRKK